MATFSVYLLIQSYYRGKREREKCSQQPTLEPSDPPRTLIQELLNPINLLYICL